MNKPNKLAMEDNDRLADFQYLWDGTEPDWVLVDVNPTHSNYESRFVVENERTKFAVIIDNDDLAREVITRMRNAGVKVIQGNQDKGRSEGEIA